MMDTGDTGFIMMCTALVFIMTHGFGILLWRYGAQEERS